MDIAFVIVKEYFTEFTPYILAFIAIIIAIYFGMKNMKNKTPLFAIRNLNLIRDYINKIEDLKISYLGNDIENVSVARIAFWNQGKETIDGDRVVDADPLQITANEGVNILSAKIISQKTPSNGFELRMLEDMASVLIKFNFIDKYDGAVFQIIHTGKERSDISISGKIKGVKTIREKNVELNVPFVGTLLKKVSRQSPILLLNIISFTMLGLSISLIVGWFLITIKRINNNDINILHCVTTLLVIIMAILYSMPGLLLVFRRIPRFYKKILNEL